MTITIPADLATVLRADADRLHVAPEALALDRLRLALAPRDAQGRFAEKGTRLRRKAKSDRPNVNNGTLNGNGKASTQSKPTGDALEAAPGEDWYKPSYIVDGEEATEEEFYDGLTPEDKASVAASFRASFEAERRGEPIVGIPGEVAAARRREHLASLRARPWPSENAPAV